MQPEIVPFATPDSEAQWDAWEARCLVSHAGHFASARNAAAAFCVPTKPLSQMRVALATSGGAHVRGMAPFNMQSRHGDDSVRWIPGDTPTAELDFSHDHYDHTDCDQDPNCILPLDRLRELAAEGVIGSVAAEHLGFMGWIPDPAHFVAETVPQVVRRLIKDEVDALILTPG